MFWNKYFLPSFLTLFAVAVLHWIASDQGYYWTVGWYDIMMHFLGGAWVTLFALWISHMKYGSMLRPFATARNLIVFTIVVGIAWELLEIALGFSDLSIKGYRLDTAYDLIMDVVGASAVMSMFKVKRS